MTKDEMNTMAAPEAQTQDIQSEETMTSNTSHSKVKAFYAHPWTQIILISMICVCLLPP